MWRTQKMVFARVYHKIPDRRKVFYMYARQEFFFFATPSLAKKKFFIPSVQSSLPLCLRGKKWQRA
jgi:hypothetical protein